VRGEQILTAIWRKDIRILGKISKPQVTVMSGITWGLSFTLFYKIGISFQISPSLQKKYFGSVEETICEVFNQNSKKVKALSSLKCK
jgi:hypothetical protein